MGIIVSELHRQCKLACGHRKTMNNLAINVTLTCNFHLFLTSSLLKWCLCSRFCQDMEYRRNMFAMELSYQKSHGMTTTILIFRYFNPLFSWSCGKRGVFMISRFASGRAGFPSPVAGKWMRCVLGQDTLLSQCLSPPGSDSSTVVFICLARRWARVKRQEIAKRRLQTNLMPGVTLRWTSILSRGE